ncbi:deoxynucleoside kinase [bacterium]|jgi:deoxyadenosine/deoxycytidine kinase|nr:deoxynucleoside kinase [bacterium]
MSSLYFNISIEGTIGAGKTSLANMISTDLKAKLILEKFEENPFLKDFYGNQDRYAFQTQLFFLLSRYSQHQDLRQVDIFSKILVSDYMFIKDRLFAALNLNDREMGLYDKVAKILERDIVYPDLAIFLQADTDKLMSNIKKRGRQYEQDIDWNYIDSLNQVYNEYFFRYDKGPLLIINTNDIDFVNNKDDFKGILNFLNEPIKGRKYYNPIKSF